MEAASPSRQADGVEWVFYDGECGICQRWVGRVQRPLSRYGFRFEPLQSMMAGRLNVPPDKLMGQMWLLTRDGKAVGGADALVHMGLRVWWLWPLRLVSRLPGGMELLRRAYRWVATHRHQLSGKGESGACGVRRQ